MSRLDVTSTSVSIIAKNPRGQCRRYYFAYKRQMLLTTTIFHVSSRVVSREISSRPSVQSFTRLFSCFSFSCHTNPPWSDVALYGRLFHYPDFSGGSCRRIRYQRPQVAYSHHRCRCNCDCSMEVFECIECTFLYRNSRMSKGNVEESQELVYVTWTVCFWESHARLSTSSNWFSEGGCNIADCIERNKESAWIFLIYEVLQQSKARSKLFFNEHAKF